MGLSTTHLLLLILVAVLLFGRGRISDLMGDVARGIKSFKKGMAEDDLPAGDRKTIDARVESERDKTKTG